MGTQILNDEVAIWMTDHASRRGQTRGVKHEAIELTARYGQKTRARAGRFKRLFTKQCAAKARGVGVDTQVVDSAIGVEVVCEENDQRNRIIISVLRKNMVRRTR